jgi:thiamine transport system ATP-binding protein
VTLSIDALAVRYGPKMAVDAVTLEVATGTVLALVGPSGCGKSTLLRAVAGLVEPNAGEISWDGESISRVPTHQRDIGLMFQDHALFTHRSVAENIGFGLKMSGIGTVERATRVHELLALVGLEGFDERPIEGLSGGEAQRVALARALAPEPKLLLLDEPLASLDRARRIELNIELERLLHELNQTAIYVTHDQDEAFSVADQVGVMHDGRLLRVGAPAEVWRDPRSEIVARFIGHETVIERSGQRFAVRSDAVSLARGDGDYTGTVISCAFQGDRHELVVDAGAHTWRFFNPDPVAVGSSVNITLNPAKLAPLDTNL